MVAAAGCNSHSNPASKAPSTGEGETAKLIAAAHLRPCPASSATSVSGGLPDITLNCLGKGPAVHLAGLTGKPMLVNVWGAWCENCQKEERFLTSAYAALHRKVRFLGIDTVDDANSALNFGASVSPPIRFPSVFDPDHKALNDLHSAATPLTVFVDARGRIVGKNFGSYLSTAAVEQDIAKYLHVTT
jgi:cytochrome c biogenesis protein CcmG, thiol:disulfide interchange protein DsbE